jgi:hypothetical protein
VIAETIGVAFGAATFATSSATPSTGPFASDLSTTPGRVTSVAAALIGFATRRLTGFGSARVTTFAAPVIALEIPLKIDPKKAAPR